MVSLEEKGLLAPQQAMGTKLKRVIYLFSGLLYAFALVEVVVAAFVYDGAYSNEIVSKIDKLRYIAETPRHGTAMILLMASGTAAVFSSILGFFGAMKSKRTILKLCAAVSLANLFLQIAGLGLAFHFAFFSSTLSKIRSLQFFYNTDAHSKALMDTLQSTFSCCGVESATEWLPAIPVSCCDGSAQCCSLQNAFSRGCWPAVAWYTQNLTMALAQLATAIAVLQLIFGILVIMASRSSSSTATGVSMSF